MTDYDANICKDMQTWPLEDIRPKSSGNTFYYSQTLKDINLNLGTEIILAAAICCRACLASSLYDIATMQRRAAVEEQSRII